MEKFNNEKFKDLAIKYYDFMEKDKFNEMDEYEEKNIEGTIYEKYFGEDIERSEILNRILDSYELIKEYNLENIFLLGISQNNTEYLLPLIEKVVIENVLKNNYEFDDISQYYDWELGYYNKAHQLYCNIKWCGINILGMNDILGVLDNFEYKDYEKVGEKEQQKFIEMIKIFEDVKIKTYVKAHDELRQSKIFSIEERIKYKGADIKNELENNEEIKKNLKDVITQNGLDVFAEAISVFTSKDYKRCCGIINGLWVLEIIRTKDNMKGFNYSTTKSIGISPTLWFDDESYIIDYNTIKNYFGKYDLIREFCDKRLEEQKNEEKYALKNYLIKVNETKQFSIKDYKEIIKDFSYDEKKEGLKKLSDYLEKEINLDDIFIYTDNEKSTEYTSNEMFKYFRSLIKPMEETFDNIRNWLLKDLNKSDKIVFPIDRLLNETKMFDEEERLRTFNAIKHYVERNEYRIRLEDERVLEGNDVLKYFSKLLKIVEKNDKN